MPEEHKWPQSAWFEEDRLNRQEAKTAAGRKRMKLRRHIKMCVNAARLRLRRLQRGCVVKTPSMQMLEHVEFGTELQKRKLYTEVDYSADIHYLETFVSSIEADLLKVVENSRHTLKLESIAEQIEDEQEVSKTGKRRRAIIGKKGKEQ